MKIQQHEVSNLNRGSVESRDVTVGSHNWGESELSLGGGGSGADVASLGSAEGRPRCLSTVTERGCDRCGALWCRGPDVAPPCRRRVADGGGAHQGGEVAAAERGAAQAAAALPRRGARLPGPVHRLPQGERGQVQCALRGEASPGRFSRWLIVVTTAWVAWQRGRAATSVSFSSAGHGNKL